ncbi:MAG: STAS domain-containing protein [Steroidobacteraceae bacterium]|nr:STAS domain-containing protein [Steroidobacteraceae bacterium]
MQMQVGDVGEGLLKVELNGRLDTPGIDQIETQLTAHLVPRGARAILDLSQVTFVASGGIRLFITIARALNKKGGKLVLYGAQQPVAQVLETTSLNDIVPVRTDSESAIATARA